MIPEASMKPELELKAYLSIVLYEVLKASLDSKVVSRSRVKVSVGLWQSEETFWVSMGEGIRSFSHGMFSVASLPSISRESQYRPGAVPMWGGIWQSSFGLPYSSEVGGLDLPWCTDLRQVGKALQFLFISSYQMSSSSPDTIIHSKSNRVGCFCK